MGDSIPDKYLRPAYKIMEGKEVYMCIVNGRVERITDEVEHELLTAAEEGQLAEKLDELFLDYKLLVNSGGEVEAILLLAEYGGPTTWLLVLPEDRVFDELAELLRPRS